MDEKISMAAKTDPHALPAQHVPPELAKAPRARRRRAKVFMCRPEALEAAVNGWLEGSPVEVLGVHLAQSEGKSATGTPLTVVTCLVFYAEVG